MSAAQAQARLAIRRIVGSRYASNSSQGNGAPRKPMINFNARTRPHDSKPGQPHPMAPKSIDFTSFGKGQPATNKSSASSSSSSSPSPSAPSSQAKQQQQASSTKGLPPADYEEFFEMPPRYWQRPLLEESEIDAIMTGGATNLK